MQPVFLLILLAVALVAVLASPTLRGLLRAIFRHPRRTTVIVELNGTRVELSDSDPTAVQAALDRLLGTGGDGPGPPGDDGGPTGGGQPDAGGPPVVVHDDPSFTAGTVVFGGQAAGNTGVASGRRHEEAGGPGE
ncbi:hypothetical protein VM636_15860 [Streptomyces sp. SCSIO 75703]|uniref:hypothetical protein n=1 Tax=unclassified Streptomyces TaxID=2593676 RepID=UPI0004C2A534|nr:hypothetical protein [Streptomyces sp. NRRL F-5065]